MTGAPFHSFAAVVAQQGVGGGPVLPDGTITFEGEDAEDTTTGRLWDFSVELNGDAVPNSV